MQGENNIWTVECTLSALLIAEPAVRVLPHLAPLVRIGFRLLAVHPIVAECWLCACPRTYMYECRKYELGVGVC